MKQFTVRSYVTVQMEITIEARNEDSACKKVQRLHDRNDWFDMLEATSPDIRSKLRESSVIDGPINLLDSVEIDSCWEA